MFRVNDLVRVIDSNQNGYTHHYPIGTLGVVSSFDDDGSIRVISDQWPNEQWMHESEIVHG